MLNITRGIKLTIDNKIRAMLTEQQLETWYHGTPDARALEKAGNFEKRRQIERIVINQELYQEYTEKMENLFFQKRKVKQFSKEYYDIADRVSELADKRKKEAIEQYTFNRPIFFSNNYEVANSYADDKRAFDYQNANPKVLKAKINPKKVVSITAYGLSFKYINTQNIKNGFLRAGETEKGFTRALNSFTWSQSDKKGIKTDAIAGIADKLGYDCVDLLGVKDNYGGNSKKGTPISTVRMVLNPDIIRIIK